MKIGIVAATSGEMEPIRKYLAERIYLKHHQFRLFTTGVGMMHSTYSLLKQLSLEKPDLAIQVGIAGGFNPLRHPIGSAVAIHEEFLGDTGVFESEGQWKDIFDLGLGHPDQIPYSKGCLRNHHERLLDISGLPRARGFTVNQISTGKGSMTTMHQRLGPDIESMEGAAFHYVCLQEDIPFIQLRGISNLVGDRDKSRWQISAAMETVRFALFKLIGKIHENGHP